MSPSENGTQITHFRMSFKSFERNENSTKKILDDLLNKHDSALIRSGQTSLNWEFYDQSELREQTFARRRIMNELKIKEGSISGAINCFKLKDSNYDSTIITDPVCKELNAVVEKIYDQYSCAFKVLKYLVQFIFISRYRQRCSKVDANIFDSALSHTRRSDASKKRRKYSRPLLDVFACGQISSPRLYRLNYFFEVQK